MANQDEEKINNACANLWEIRNSLFSLGVLFEGSSRDLMMDQEEYSGVGQMLKILSREVGRVEKYLYSKDTKSKCAADES